MKISREDKYLYLILVIALIFRIPGIFDGLPAVYNSTEHFLARMALSMGAGKTIDPGLYIYPTFYTYILLILYGSYYLICNIFNIFGNQYDFAAQFLTDPSAIYILSRIFNVGLSLMTIVFIYQFLKRQTNLTTAKIAATFMAISLNLVRFSSYATADTLLILFSTLTILFFYKLADSPSKKDFFITGFFCGLSIAAKYNAGFLAIGLILLVIQRWYDRRIQLFPALSLSFGGIAIGFFITNPLWLIYPEKFYQGWQVISSQMYSAVSAERGTPFLWEISHLIQQEMIIGFLFVLSTVFYIIRRDYKHYPLLIVIILTFLYVGTWTKKGIDYLYAIFPAWIILSASFLDHIQKTYINKKIIKIFVVLIILLPSFVSVILHSVRLTNPDTREQATEWIVHNINKEQTVCYDNYHNDLGVFDIERYLSYGASADQLPDGVKEKLIQFSTDSRQVSFISIVVQNTNDIPETDIAYEEIALKYRRRTLNELLDKDTSFFISNNWYYDSYLSIEIDDYPPGVQKSIREVQEFYKQLTKNYTPVKVFSPEFWTAGPSISIYDLR